MLGSREEIEKTLTEYFKSIEHSLIDRIKPTTLSGDTIMFPFMLPDKIEFGSLEPGEPINYALFDVKTSRFIAIEYSIYKGDDFEIRRIPLTTKLPPPLTTR